MKRSSYRIIPLILLAALAAPIGSFLAYGLEKDSKRTEAIEVKAPEFPKDTRWLNTEAPVTLAAMKGRVVVLDFWTYCCINCLHALPRLAALDEKYKNRPVTVIGVHSGKFDQEKSDEKVKHAIRKYGVRHPVAMDDEYEIWTRWGVRAWPTVAFIRPDGTIYGVTSGEPDPGQLETVVDQLLAEGEKTGTLSNGGAPALRREKPPGGRFLYPGKVLAVKEGVFVADSGHHRVVRLDEAGAVSETYGGPEAGFADGPPDAVRFREPQGMAIYEGRLFIADRGNHAIRELDLESGRTKTLAGTGKKARGIGSGGPALSQALRSPWALAWRDSGLDVAMAGSHQIWRYENGVIRPLAGSGLENILDGGLSGAAFAQPSGLALSGGRLYVADSETSAVRVLDFGKRRVDTLVGSGLFDFGYVDGYGRAAKLQHPLGITARGDTLYIADSFNNAIRTLDLAVKNRVGTLKMEGVRGLNEPSGLSVLGDILYVADTNRHRILKVDLKTGRSEIFAE